jgi:hypothetical protein
VSTPRDDTTRRDFLKVAAAAVPAAAVSAVVPEAARAEAIADDRMQDTAHTRAYYDSARF